MDCIICKIINKEIPSYVVYEDDLFIAFLDRYPTNPGHVLISPKRHTDDVFGLTEEEAIALMPIAQKIANKIKKEINPHGLNLVQNNGKAAGQVIFHYHLHIIPRYEGDGVIFKATPNDPSSEEFEQMLARLKV